MHSPPKTQLDAPANALSAWLVLASDLAEAEALEATGLAERGLATLVLVANHPGCSADWLYRRLGITQSGTVRLLDRLEGMGLVSRERAQGRREVSLRLTVAGETRLARGLRARASALEMLLAPLSESERAQLAALSAKALAAGTRRRRDADVACRLCDWKACRPDCPLDASVIDDPAAGQ